MVEALALDMERMNYDQLQRIEDFEDISDLCGSLVTTQSGVLKLAHYSVKEYLVSKRLSSSSQSAYYVSREDADLYIAQSCLLYLQHYDQVQKAALNNRKQGTPLEQSKTLSLYPYSIYYWPHHYQFSKKPAKLTDLVLKVFGHPSSFFADYRWSPPSYNFGEQGLREGTIFEEIDSVIEDAVSRLYLLKFHSC
jgi:hypothetical protein